MKNYKVNEKSWDNFLNNAMDPHSDHSNFKVTFKELTKKFGQPYMLFCKAMWEANENVMSEEEFCIMNGNIPKGFFDKVIKN